VVHNIEAIYDHGVFRPVEPLALPEGARVQLRVDDKNGELDKASKKVTDYEAWLDALSGRWQGEFARGNEGDLEERESLS
jgi:predicted DNA-binding antitoxin AbrB/MazE fold protein